MGNKTGIFKTFKVSTDNAILRENGESFLGSKNEGLNIYLLDKLDKNKIDKNNPVLGFFVNYFNKNFRKNYYNLNHFGFKSVDYADKRYNEIYQRNVRFSSGTSILLDMNSEEALFLTNNHVLFDKNNRPTWTFFGYPFILFYFNNRINFIPSPDYSWVLDTLQIKEEYEKKGNKFQKKSNSKSKPEFVKKTYEKYFRLAPDFNRKNKDLGLFYFKYKEFIADFSAAVKFFEQHQNEIKATFDWAKRQDTQKRLKDFERAIQVFSKYFEQMSKLGPVKLSERVWKNGDIDYETKLGLFWPRHIAAKNMFKGVYIRGQEATFFATNGHGASGSGIFNTDGSLAFVNYIIVKDPAQKDYYSDQNNLFNFLTAAIALKTPYINLVDEIYKFYYNKNVRNTLK
ncbi:hypothetical protein DR099_00805 [Mycoplasma hyopneumoniae]|nr:hypothetical protein [Mesomycoplasma hyopneumoniae]